MPITKSAAKAHKVSLNKRLVNDRYRRAIKRAVKNMETSVKEKDFSSAETGLKDAYKALDKATKHGLIKKNAASRKKSRLVAMVRRASEKAETAKKEVKKAKPKAATKTKTTAKAKAATTKPKAKK